jgi:FixJ family two-component response regulator
MDQTCPIICVLDNEPKFCRVLARLLKTHGFYFVTFTHAEESVAAWASWLSNCVLPNLHMTDYRLLITDH